MRVLNVNIYIPSLLLLTCIYCSHQNNHDDPNWIKYLPSSVIDILKARTTTISGNNEESSLSSTEDPSSWLIHTTDTQFTPEIMHDYGNNNSSPKVVVIGAPIGGIILLFLCCCCCYKCCCGRPSVSQGVVIQQPQPPPQDTHQPNIVIQHIHQPAQPTMVHNIHHPYAQPPMTQQIHHQHIPPQMEQHIQPPQFQQQPPYPTDNDTRQMLQQEWSPHAPVNQQYPIPDYPYNPSAPPPSYGKY